MAREDATDVRFQRLVSYLRRLVDQSPQTRDLARLFRDHRVRIEALPASTRTDYFGCYPGGWIDYVTGVIETALKLNTALDAGLLDGPILLVGLVHALGQIGEPDQMYYGEQESRWHRDRGQLYEVIQPSVEMGLAERSLWWCQQYSVPLTLAEYQAIRYIYAMCGYDDRGRRDLNYRETPLLTVMSFAREWTTRDMQRRDRLAISE